MSDPIIEKLEGSYPFRVDAYCESYPDVILEIILNGIPTDADKTLVEKAIGQFFEGYNRRHFLRPLHYAAILDAMPELDHPRGIYAHIDCGNASPKALLSAVSAIERSGLSIFRVALK